MSGSSTGTAWLRWAPSRARTWRIRMRGWSVDASLARGSPGRPSPSP